MSLISVLQSCDYIINCVDVYDWQGRIYVILEMMENGSMTDIIVNMANYSEEFCKYSLYCVAKGL